MMASSRLNIRSLSKMSLLGVRAAYYLHTRLFRKFLRSGHRRRHKADGDGQDCLRSFPNIHG